MRLNRIMPVLLVALPMPGCDDEFQGASTSIAESWTVNSPPTVVIDACGGGIWVRRSKVNEVKAVVARNSSCKNRSQTAAEESLRFIDVRMSKEEETIRIVTRRTDNGATGCDLTTSVGVYVPDDAKLDLRTDIGSIWVTGSPREVKASNSGGATRFELEPPGHTKTADPQPLKLEGWGGDVEIKLGPTGYEFNGSVKVVENWYSDRQPEL